ETAIDIGKKFLEYKTIKNSKEIIDIAKKLKIENWQNISNIGPEVAKSIFEYFSKKENEKFLEKLDKAGVTIISPKITMASQKLKGKIFVLTGGLETLTREEAKDRIRSLGGDISSSVSKAVDYVIVGSEPGEKYEKAKKLGVKIITEKEFIKMLR
ncbi:MAG: ligase protein, partial [Parcubacteria group bacterium GW2011_GWB1_43_6]